MILHGVEAPNIIHTPNTLAENLADIQEKRPLWCGCLPIHLLAAKKEQKYSKNFPIRTGETASLFCSILLKFWKQGKAGIMIKNTFWAIPTIPPLPYAKPCWKTATLHTVLDLPVAPDRCRGKTNEVVFWKGKTTQKFGFTSWTSTAILGKTNLEWNRPWWLCPTEWNEGG